MDAGNGSHSNGNGNADPSAALPQSSPPAGGNGHPPEPLVVVEEPARDEKGRIKKGHSGNPKGRPPGIPNRNAELVRLINTRQLAWCWRTAKAQARKGDDSLLRFLLDKTLLDQSPASAGIVINASASAQASATSQTNIHDRLEELRDPGVLAGVGDLVDRLAARRGITGTPRHGN